MRSERRASQHTLFKPQPSETTLAAANLIAFDAALAPALFNSPIAFTARGFDWQRKRYMLHSIILFCCAAQGRVYFC